jgi:DNA-binding SARP family transcriptional activator
VTQGLVGQSRGSRRALLTVVSSVVLVSIIVAVPAVLIALGGSPLSHLDLGHSLPTLSSHGSETTGSSAFVMRWLARGPLLVAWILWLWMTVCITLEFRSRVTGRSSIRLPASRTMQSLAACLVGTTLAFAVASRVSPGPGAAPERSFRAIEVSSPLSSRPLLPIRIIEDLADSRTLSRDHGDPAAAVSSTTAPTASAPVFFRTEDSEERRSSYPTIESEQRGPTDPVGTANAAAATAQTSTDITGTSEAGPTAGAGQYTQKSISMPSPASARAHRVKPRETLWSVAADRLGSAMRWRELAALNYGVPQADGGTLTTEHWIREGWWLELPQRSGRYASTGGTLSPFSNSVSPDSLGPTGQLAADPFPYPSISVAPDNESPLPPDRCHLPIVPLGGGVVGAGVVSFLDRLRKVQQRHRPGGMFIRLPDRRHRFFEQRLRVGGGGEVVAAADAALVVVAEECRCSGAVAPNITAITVGSESVELLMDSANGLANPKWLDGQARSFKVRPNGTVIVIDRRALAVPSPGSDSSGVSSLAPLIVTAGHRREGLVLVNLESLGTVAVTGVPADCEGVLRALALELATSFWSGRFDLILVGFGAELARFDRVEAMEDTSALLDTVARRRIAAAHLLRETGHASFAQGRWSDGSHRWDPVAILCGPKVTQDVVAELCESIPGPHLGIAVVAVADSRDGQTAIFSSSEKESSFDLLRSVVPQHVGADDLVEAASLIELAADRQATFRSDEPYLSLPIPLPVLSPDTGDANVRPGRTGSSESLTRAQAADDGSRPAVTPQADVEVEVAILGHLDIRGAAREFTRAWSKELVVYLAMHPYGASNDAWATALWPERIMAPSSLHSTASVARRALGHARNGQDHLPHSHGRLTLANTVGTDWDRFTRLADSPDAGAWRSALALVRGRPFEGLRASDWPILEGIGPAIESAVVDLSCGLAEACLSADDPRGAEWAARRGLLVSPYDERLYRLLMKAADLAGHPAGVESVMAELVKVVADDIEPLDSVHPSTVDLYRSLTRRRAPTNKRS